MTDQALNITELKNNNRYRILSCLRLSPLSRAELTQKIGLSKSSVTILTNQLIKEGLIREVGLAEKSKKAGRTRILLDINENYGFTAGISLHRKQISVAITNLKAKTLFFASEKTENFSSPEDALFYINTTLSQLISEHKLSWERMVGIGVSSPGPIDHKNGIILEPPKFNLFHHFPIVKKLQEYYNCPVFLERDAVTLALYEYYYICPYKGTSLFVTIQDGIGSILLQDGELYRGSYGTAGELGHISVNPLGEACPCGNRGCLEQYATLSALKERFHFISYQEMVNGALSGNKTDVQAFDFLVQTLGTALVSAANLFDLEHIIFYGEYSYQADHLANALQTYIQKHSVIAKVHPVLVRPSRQEEHTKVAAAAVPALNHFFKNTLTV